MSIKEMVTKIAEENGRTKIWVNFKAHQMVQMGLAKDMHEALTAMMEWI